MNPSKVDRTRLAHLTDLPNVGPTVAADLRLLGFDAPAALAAADPFEMYERLCRQTGQRHDPCVLDVFMSIADFMQGGPPRPWWAFTATRKQQVSQRISQGATNDQRMP